MIGEKEKQYLLAVVESLPRELVVISPSFEIMAANKFAREIYGEDIVGKKCYEIYYGMDKPCSKCKIPQVLTGKNLQEKSVFSDFYLEEKVTFFPIIGTDCKGCMVKLDFDLTAIDRLEKKLHLSNAFLYNLILSAVDAVIAADKKGRIFIFNDAASAILGYSREEALKEVNIRQMYPGDGAREVMRKLRSKEYGGPGKLKAYKVDLLNKKGELIPVSLNASIIYENGIEVATIGFFHDLRETIKMEKELEETRLQLYQSSKMAALGNLAAGVAHQLNNPLSGILLFAQLLLEDESLSEQTKEDLQRIVENARRCKETVKELLEFSRQSPNKPDFHNINHAIEKTLFLLEKHSLFKHIEIKKLLEGELPLVKCDIQQLNHVFMNIIWNAAQAMNGKGSLEISTFKKGKNHIGIKFIDTGCGIDEKDLPFIFDPFFSTKNEGEGIGLGLSIAYRIIENHGGRIWAYNNTPAPGATLEIEIPVEGK